MNVDLLILSYISRLSGAKDGVRCVICVLQGIREGRHLQAGSAADRGCQGAGGVLHPALCGHLREG